MAQEEKPQVSISRLYLKDLSFESPSSPEIFTKNFQPDVQVKVGVRPKRVQDSLWEISLDLNIQGKAGEETIFIVEIEHCGLFEIKNVPDAQLESILTVFCPATIFPYARQVIDTAMISGGFPPLMMAPLDFEMLRRGGKSPVAEEN